MNIFTDGTSFAHARTQTGGHLFVFELRSEAQNPDAQGPDSRLWWGQLRKDDVVTAAAVGPRVEILDERFRRIARDVSAKALVVPRTGVHYVRMTGDASAATLRVNRSEPKPSTKGWTAAACAAAAMALVLIRFGI